MSTLAEIEAAVEQLPIQEQHVLLATIAERLQGREAVLNDPVMTIIGAFEGEPGPTGRNAEDILYGRSETV